MKMIFTLVFLILPIARAEILFEGYYKVTQFSKHIGFIVQRNELDAKTNQFKTTSFLKLAKSGFDMTESLQAVSSVDLVPVRYTYIATDGKKTRSIDAEFLKGKTKALVIEDGKKKNIDKNFGKDAFLSSALYYMMLKSKTGLKTDTKFDFTALVEETLEESKGSSTVGKKLITVGKLQLLKVTNKFAGSEYENLLTDKGEVFSASTPATGIKTELVKNTEEALEGVKLTAGVLEKIFGEVPAGKINPLFTR